MSNLPDVDFDISNPDPRCACILVLDTSTSMSGAKINQLNKGLKILSEELKKDALARVRVELMVITFGPVEIKQNFTLAQDFEPIDLVADYDTPLGEALELALEQLEERKQVYKSAGVSYYRPWIFLITDGEPNDEWERVAKKIKKAENSKKVAFFSVGVDGADMTMLAELSERGPLKLNGLKFVELFQWLSTSLTSVSMSSVDDTVQLKKPDWTQV